MKQITIKRRYKEKTCVVGKLYLDETFLCFTLEEDEEGLASGKDLRIPADTYKLEWYQSPKFSPRLAKALNVANQKAIRIYNDKVAKERCILIHAGNTHKDTLGCILLGKGFVTGSDSITQSTQAVKEFYEKLNELKDLSNLKLVIVNEF
ncbi:hypothetical protein DMB92_09030 [Campylobacter sp. MIT 99-7217]|uniref:DUF5675 family protein n=1 Tax=Campylobacter sp. MIT 99-7217 TaxID=535091 RepID=UPI00115808F8|nr:DUF5675 family protein [Campylobacter sp. MIT 99-7217]TQR28703.1 hypothetical protein DMB92_09030 [Campylobacter sp. MIT 99-7217]